MQSFGKSAPGRNNLPMFVAGQVHGVTGIFRSDDVTSLLADSDYDRAQAHWVLVASRSDLVADTRNPLPMSGIGPLQLEGDPDLYGRVYASGVCRGLFYSDRRQ